MTRQGYIFIILAGGFLLWRLMRNKKVNDKEYVFKQVAKRFGFPIARSVEKIYRLETGNFKKGFQDVYGAGMQPAKDRFPYGWISLRDFWVNNPSYRPVGIVSKRAGGGIYGTDTGMHRFLRFPNFLAGAMTVAKRIQIKGNNPGAWFSNDPTHQMTYNNAIDKINSKIVDSIT